LHHDFGKATLMPAVGLALVGLLGLAVGSFLNVVIYRVPRRLSVAKPPSACPGCAAEIAWRDNIPVLSWLMLRGRCRACRMRISPRYPAVELLTGGLFVLVAVRFGWSTTLPAMLLLVSGLVALAFIDLDQLLLPKRIFYPTALLVGGALVGAAAADGSWRRLGVAAACAAGAFLVFFAMHVASPNGLGFGDVRLAPLIGGALGWVGARYALLGFITGAFLGAVIGMALIALRRHGRRDPLPFGVFLALGAVVALPLGQVVHYA
jgi:leader peptidase (prepilin peptidase)/N-methyltransferase